jgi:hypothetical protein
MRILGWANLTRFNNHYRSSRSTVHCSKAWFKTFSTTHATKKASCAWFTTLFPSKTCFTKSATWPKSSPSLKRYNLLFETSRESTLFTLTNKDLSKSSLICSQTPSNSPSKAQSCLELRKSSSNLPKSLKSVWTIVSPEKSSWKETTSQKSK